MESAVISRSEYKTNSYSTTLDLLIHCLCFLSVLFIGADIIGIHIGVNLRLDQIFLLLLTICLIIRNSYKLNRSIPVIAFILLTFISSLLAYNVIRGFIYYVSILYNVFVVFYCFSNYITTYGLNKTINICRKTIYVQIALLLLQIFLKVGLNISIFTDYGYYFGIPRFCLWFYEPSYFATYFVFWFTFCFYQLIINQKKDYLKDVLCCAIAILLSTSGTGYIGLALSVVIVYLIWISKDITSKKLVVLAGLIAIVVVLSIVFRSVIDVFVNRIFNDGLSNASGGRVEGWSETYKVFQDNILFGVGPGNYGLYLFDDASIVPTNVTLELLSTTGLFATIAFYSLTIAYIVRNRLLKDRNNSIVKINTALVLALVIFTIILQVNQGYLRLYHWMFFGLIEGSFLINEKENLVSKQSTSIGE